MDEGLLSKEIIKLHQIMTLLRSEEGCPWDREQTHKSLCPYILEEAYEVIEAINTEEKRLIKEELGDLLLQVVFQAQIAEEKGDFDLADIINNLIEKLIRRHPHVFGEELADTPAEVKLTWQKIKESEKNSTANKSADNKCANSGSVFSDCQQNLPALLQSHEVQELAAEVGFDWDDISPVFEKVKEELAEVEEAAAKEDQEEVAAEIGDLLFAVVNLSRFLEVNPEVALLGTIKRFKDRFSFIEETALDQAKNLSAMSLTELDALWEEAKTAKGGEQ